MPEFKMDIEEKFVDYMKNIKQVFLYAIDDCNLDCEQCLYKPNNYFHLKRKEIKFEEAANLVHDFFLMGAEKLTIMGGEPTLYDKKNNRESLLRLIEYSKKLGYKYVRIDTNGTFDSKLLSEPRFMMLDEVTFSLDGPSADINDAIRGKGVFKRCVANIKEAIQLGYNCHITCCIHKNLLSRNDKGQLYFERMIEFAEELGVQSINFHDLFKSNIPRDTWSGNIDVSPSAWYRIWPEIEQILNKDHKALKVRVPQGLVDPEEFDNHKNYYGYCSAKLGDRILVHPDGILRICSLMIGTPYGIAKYYDNKIIWDYGYTNELGDQNLDEMTPCTHQYKNVHFKSFVPLCVSFKPKQDEYVWNKMNWENRL